MKILIIFKFGLKHVKYIFNKSTVILRQNLTEKFAKKVNAGSK